MIYNKGGQRYLTEIKKSNGEVMPPKNRRLSMSKRFSRAEIRRIIGEDKCTDEMENELVALHLGVVDPLKDELEKNRADVEKIAELQKQLDEQSKDDYKSKYEKEHNDFENYRASIEKEKNKAIKEQAAKTYFESKGITGANLDIALRGAREEIGAIELDGDEIKDTKSLDELINGTFKGLVTVVTRTGANVPTPAGNTGGVSFDSLSLVDKMKFANEHPGDEAVKQWLKK